MNNDTKSWLQLYVDATTERDPYKRLALVRELRRIPKHDESEERTETVLERRPPSSVRPSRHQRRSSKLRRSGSR